ncbi:MAG: GNAT family N-acetyltransferase, partial [Telluria sp.]
VTMGRNRWSRWTGIPRIAALLVLAAEQWAREQGCTEMASDAMIDNTASHAMHLALGFEETERVVYFRKPL